MGKQIREVEFKWSWRNLAEADRLLTVISSKRAHFRQAQTFKIQDQYLDTPSFDLTRQKIRVRLRKINSNFQLTIKQAGEMKHGLAIRNELTTPVKSKPSKIDLLKRYLPAPIRSQIHRKRLRILFEFRNFRTTYFIEHSKFSAELSFDQLHMTNRKKGRKFSEIELEFIKGSLSEFKKFTTQLTIKTELKPQTRSKVLTAWKFFNLPS